MNSVARQIVAYLNRCDEASWIEIQKSFVGSAGYLSMGDDLTDLINQGVVTFQWKLYAGGAPTTYYSLTPLYKLAGL